jgi:hypothetical protein
LVKPATNLVQILFEPKGCPYILWTQISRVVLVYDVKINQLGRKNLVGRKNLAGRFDMYQIGGGENNCQNPREIISSRE